MSVVLGARSPVSSLTNGNSDSTSVTKCWLVAGCSVGLWMDRQRVGLPMADEAVPARDRRAGGGVVAGKLGNKP